MSSVFYAKTFVNSPRVASSLWGYRNTIPYGVTAYRRTYAEATENFDARNYNAEVEAETLDPSGKTALSNRLASQFAAQLGDASSFGATLTAEARQTFSMLSGTVLRLARAAACARRLDLVGVATHLGLPFKAKVIKTVRYTKAQRKGGRNLPPRRIVSRKQAFYLPTGRLVLKTVANGWLFWSYGAKPLMQDVYNGLDVLDRPLVYEKKIRAYSRDPYSASQSHGGPKTGYYFTTTHWSGTVYGACGATVSVSNPNAYLLNKMGLANPAQWILEAIPFSFVVDWFSNLTQVVNHWTQYDGFTLLDRWSSYKYGTSRSFTTASPYGGSYSVRGFVMRRIPGLPTPKLQFAYERFSLQRALNAISLLVGFLPHK